MAKVKNENNRNPILWFLFAIVIPAIVALVIAVVVLSFAGVDVAGWAKEKGSNIPVVSNFIKSNEDKALETKLAKANETIQAQTDELSDLEREIESLEGIIDDLELDIKRLENRNQSEENLSNTSPSEADEEVKKVAASFRKMDEVKAANIVQNLDKNIAVEVLANLSGDVRGAIMAEMEPKLAADLMEDMMNR